MIKLKKITDFALKKDHPIISIFFNSSSDGIFFWKISVNVLCVYMYSYKNARVWLNLPRNPISGFKYKIQYDIL